MEKQILFDLRNFATGADIVNSIISQKYAFIASGGGVRGGKTANNIGGLILLHKMFPKSRSVIIRQSLKVLEQNTLPVCHKIVPKQFVQKYNAQKHAWTFKNGSYMFFLSENYDQDKDHDQFNGLEVNFIFIDQMEEIQETTFDKCIERAGSYMLPIGYKQPKPVILGTVNPTLLWPKRVFYDPWKKDALPKNWRYIPALLKDNPHIDDSYKEALEELRIKNPKKYLQFVTGNWDIIDTTGLEFYWNFNVEHHVGRVKEKYNPELPLHISFDFNFMPFITMTIYQIQDNKIMLIDEICMPPPGNTARNLAKKFAQKYSGQVGMIYVYGDYSAKNSSNHEENYFDGIFAELRNSGFRIKDCVVPNPSVSLRGEFINEVFLTGSLEYSLLVDEMCKNAIEDLFSIQKKPDGTKHKPKVRDPKTKQTYEEKGHCSDTFDYFICEILKNEFLNYKQRAKKQTVVVQKPANLMRF